jgi:hypothetical protein
MHDHGQEHERENEQEQELEHERRQDIEHWLAAAAPEEVPVVVDLHHRARALGRRRRTQHRVLAAGGVGVTSAAVVAAVFVVGHASPATAMKTSTAPATTVPSKPLGTNWNSPLEDDRPAAQAAVKSFEATLPAGSTVKNAKAFVGNPAQEKLAGSLFGVAFDVVEPSGRAYNLQVDVSMDPYKDSWDCDKPIQCSDARFLGHDVQWQSSPAGPPTYTGTYDTAFTVRDLTTHYNFGFHAQGKNLSKLPDPQELRTIGLNEKLGEALVAAFEQTP